MKIMISGIIIGTLIGNPDHILVGRLLFELFLQRA